PARRLGAHPGAPRDQRPRPGRLPPLRPARGPRAPRREGVHARARRRDRRARPPLHRAGPGDRVVTRSVAAAAALAAGLSALALLGCGDAGSPSMGGGPRAPRPVRVTTIAVRTRPLTYSVQAIGSLEAYQVVTVA